MKITNKIKRKRILTKKRIYTTTKQTKPNTNEYIKVHRKSSEAV